jgi:hypothetical protein
LSGVIDTQDLDGVTLRPIDCDVGQRRKNHFPRSFHLAVSAQAWKDFQPGDAIGNRANDIGSSGRIVPNDVLENLLKVIRRIRRPPDSPPRCAGIGHGRTKLRATRKAVNAYTICDLPWETPQLLAASVVRS